MSETIATIEFKEAIYALYINDRYFKFLDLEFRGLDDTDFRFGGLYRCIQDFCANDLGPHDMEFGCANAGETMWFIGVDYFAYDGLQALFFHDGGKLREFVFTDVRPEEEGRINKAFKAAPHAYFQEVGDDSDIGRALATLREGLLQEKRARWPRYSELEQFRSRP